MKSLSIIILLALAFIGCGNNNDENTIEASGNIEATNVMVSSKVSGEILKIKVVKSASLLLFVNFFTSRKVKIIVKIPAKTVANLTANSVSPKIATKGIIQYEKKASLLSPKDLSTRGRNLPYSSRPVFSML